MSDISVEKISKLIPYLTSEEKVELHHLLKSNETVWAPLPGPQFEAYYCDADVIGYGGAAGGGKTDLAIGKALTRHTHAQIFRRNGTETLGIIQRLKELLGHDKGFNGSTRIWDNPVPGVDIEFGSCPNLGDEKKYQGRPKDLLVVDEAAHFLEAQVRYLMAWVRTTKPGQKCQTLLTFNPPEDDEAMWLIKYFAPWLDDTHPNPAKSGEIRYFAMLDGKETEVASGDLFEHKGELIIPQSRTFILSKIWDNPYLLRSGYVGQLQSLEEPHRSRLLYANFKAALKDNPMQVIPSKHIVEAMERWQEKHVKPELMAAGMDVARGGQDNTALALRYAGYWFDVPKVWPGKQTPDGPTAAGLVLPFMRDGAPLHIELPGVGESVYDHAKAVYRGPTVAVNVGSGATSPDKNNIFTFANMRSQLVWRMREALDPASNLGMALPPDKRLKEELASYRWRLSGRTVYVESRDEIVKRIGRSPDVATAYILALIDTPKISNLAGQDAASRRKRNSIGHDPYEVLFGKDK